MYDFGLRLQQLRMGLNLSQEALGKKLNRSKSVICAYENNLSLRKQFENSTTFGAYGYSCSFQCFP